MQRVYKCDYCSETNSLEDEMAQHELHCTFNPYNKSCATCVHSACYADVYFGAEPCSNHIGGDLLDDIQDGITQCDIHKVKK